LEDIFHTKLAIAAASRFEIFWKKINLAESEGRGRGEGRGGRE
jgi:hypothetical protein